VDRKRQRAARIRGFADRIRNTLRRDPRKVFLAGGGLGAALLGTVFFLYINRPYVPFGPVLGFMMGYLATLALTPGALRVAWLCQRWADRCEQSADQMEPTRRRHSR
jgi:hypothetical protein